MSTTGQQTPLTRPQKIGRTTMGEPIDSNSIELDSVEETMIRGSLRAFLVCKPSAADAHLRAPIRTLVRKAGGLFSDGTFLAFDRKTNRHIAVTWPKKEADLSDLVAQTAEPIENGGQGSTALIDLLRRVARRLYALAVEERDRIMAASTVVKMEFGDEKEGMESIGERYGVYTDINGDKLEFTPHSLRENVAHVQPSCIVQSWFQAMAMRPGLGDSATFDELNNTIRCRNHVVDFSSGKLKIRALKDTDRMLLDAGHELKDVTPSPTGGFTGDVEEQVEEARAMMVAWMGANADFFLVSIAERLFSTVRKEAHVFETPSDRGKTALLDVLVMGLGTYARRLPNDALSGSNKRTAPIHEATLSRQGVRFILHDEADTVDWNYLKTQSNAAAAEEWGVGMTATLSAAHKATRVVTRNATREIDKVLAAPADCRRKVVLWTGDTLLKPPTNEELHTRIVNKDPTLARAFFLLLVETFGKHERKRPSMPDALVAGIDLVPVAAVDGGGEPFGAMDTMMTALTLTSRRAFHELYRPSTTAEGGTKADDVHRAICARGTLPPMISKLSLDGFTTDVLCAGQSVPGDPNHVPVVQTKSFTGASGDPKRARVNNVMMCLPRNGVVV